MGSHRNDMCIKRLIALNHLCKLGRCLGIEHFIGSRKEDRILFSEKLLVIITVEPKRLIQLAAVPEIHDIRMERGGIVAVLLHQFWQAWRLFLRIYLRSLPHLPGYKMMY